MKFLHSLNIMHRDLKSPNVLLTRGDGTDDGTMSSSRHIIAKVADFGFSCSMSLFDSLQGKVVENPMWLAPEILAGSPYTLKADIYAYGVVMWEMLTRDIFFGDVQFRHQLEDRVVQGLRPEIPQIEEMETEVERAVVGKSKGTGTRPTGSLILSDSL